MMLSNVDMGDRHLAGIRESLRSRLRSRKVARAKMSRSNAWTRPRSSDAAVRSKESTMADIDEGRVVAVLNRILEMELAGVVRYTHYSLLVFGYNRIPIVSWLRAQADEALTHAQQAGEMVTHLGAH